MMISLSSRLPLSPRQQAFTVLFLLFILRLYQITGPIVDHHSWNQVSAAAMAKYIYYDWNALFYPTVDLYNNVPADPTSETSTSSQLNRIYAQEFPLYHIPVALLYHLTGVTEWPGRLVSIAFGLLGLWYLYLFSCRLFGHAVGMVTLIIAGISPLNWFFHRAIMSDTCMVTAMIAGMYYFYLWTEDQNQDQFLWYATFWTLAAGLFKPFGLIIQLSYGLLILFRKEYSLFRSPKLIGAGLLAWIPSLIWIYHAVGLNVGRSEFSKTDKMLTWELFFTWDFYSRVIFARLIDQLLTPWAAVFCIIGLACIRIRDSRFHAPLAWLLGCVAYLIMVQQANYIHDYYQLLFVPILSWFAGIGVLKIWNGKLSLLTRKLWLGSFFVLFVTQSTIYVANHFRYGIGSFHTGNKISELSQNPEDKVIAFEIGATKRNQLIYYSNRNGWFLENLTVEELERWRSHGARWLGVNLLASPHFQNYEPILKQIETKYPKVWEDRSHTDHYDRPVVSQVYDLCPPQPSDQQPCQTPQ